MTQLTDLFAGGSGQQWELLHIQDQKSPGTPGGTSNNTTWQTRDLNTVLTNQISGASLNNNQITLPAGEYFISAKCCSYNANENKIHIWNITDSSLILEGMNKFGNTNSMNPTIVEGKFNLSGSKTIEIQHRCYIGKATNGLGIVNNNIAVNAEIYSDVQIWRKVSSLTLPQQAPLLHVEDQKSYTTTGGTFYQDAWRTRDLNTVVTNDISGASLNGSSQITLPSGKYYIEAKTPAYNVTKHMCRLYNITGSVELALGSSAYTANNSCTTLSILANNFTLSTSSVLEIQHYCHRTQSSNGFGVEGGLIAGINSIFTVVNIWKLS